MRTALILEELTHSVIGAFFEVYRHLGYGFVEHLYVMALEDRKASVVSASSVASG